MSVSGRWHIRWRPKAKQWLDQRVRHITPTRRRTLRFAFDRTLQQIAQFPYSGQRCNVRFAELGDLSNSYRAVIIQDLVLVHIQTTAMDTPRPDMLTQ